MCGVTPKTAESPGQPKQFGLWSDVASIRFAGVLFVAYPQDHAPRHVHGFVDEAEVIVDLRLNRTVALADRPDAIRPGNAKRTSVRRVLKAAAEHFDELIAIWERMHA